MYGLMDRDLKYIIEVLSSYPEVEEGLIFGSRALGNYKAGSDVDLSLKGKLSSSILTQISRRLNEEYPLPYFFDILDYTSISNDALIKHIDSYGKTIYHKDH